MDRQLIIKLLIGALCLAAVVAIFAIATGGDLDETSARALGTALAISFHMLLSLAGLSLNARREPWSWLGAVAVAIAAIAALLTVIWIWTIDDDGDEGPWKAALILLFLSWASAQGSLLVKGIAERSPATQWVRLATFGLALILALLLSVTVSENDEILGAQAWGVLAVLYALGTVLSPLMRFTEARD